MNRDLQKQAAARRALDFIEDGMTVGLGTGSTAEHFVRFLGERVAGGLSVRGVPTSKATEMQARQAGIPVTTLDEVPGIDVTVDGADEVDRNLQLIKGGGGALLCEKIVASASSRMIVITDESKLVDRLGAFALPVEVVRFGVSKTLAHIEDALAAEGMPGIEPQLRRVGNGDLFVSDEGNWIADCPCKEIKDPAALAARLSGLPGVVEHGLFIDVAWKVIVGDENGVRLLERP